MRGSGLSLERFIKGKAHKTKGEAKSKKRAIVHKAQRRREYEKVKRREASAGPSEGSSFYDRFFQDLRSGKAGADEKDEEEEENEDEDEDDDEEEDASKAEPAVSVKPDPFFKARKKADVARQEKQRAREDKQRRRAELEKKVSQRKKRHVKLSVRTASGQPVVRNHIGDILSKLQAEQRANGGGG